MSTPHPARPTVRLGVEKLEDRTNPSGYFDDSLVVGFTPGAEQAALTAIAGVNVATSVRSLGFGVYKLNLRAGVSAPQALSAVTGKPGVQYAELDYKVTKEFVPNDPRFSEQWALQNTGQTGGTAGADMNAVRGWDVNRGNRTTVVAVLEGVDYTHPDLAPNMYRNPGEIPGNGVDDDGNGYTDDVHGIDTEDGDGDPMPNAGDTHGTHVAGIVGAAGNNGLGVSGVATNTRLMAIKMGGISAIVEGINYAIASGVRVMNASWSFIDIPRPAAFEAAVVAAKQAGIILVCSAGNQTRDNDTHDRWPSNFIDLHDNVVPVAALDHNDQMASFSNYGLRKVPLGAPGVDILSTLPGGGYVLNSGTSMASPQVAGAVTLAFDQSPTATYAEVVRALYDSVTPIPALVGKTSTSGKLNLFGLLSSLGSNVFATGAGEGGGPHVKVYRGAGSLVASFYAYDPKFTGGVRVATGDVNGDRKADVVTVAGPGGGPHVKVFDGDTFQPIASFFAFEPGFTGGLTVATGDVNADGLMDVIVGADRGGGPRVSVFAQLTAGGAFTRIADFFAYDPGFRGGVNVAAGVFTAGGKQADVVTAPGRGGGPHVRRFSAAALLAGRATVVSEAMVGDPNDRSGLFVSTGDLNGDKVADVITGAASGDPVVRMSNGSNMAPMGVMRNPFTGQLAGLMDPADPLFATAWTSPTLLNGLLPPGAAPSALVSTDALAKPGVAAGFMFGARVAAQDINGDKVADIIVAGGPNDAPTVALVNGADLSVIRDFTAYTPSFFGGVFVGGAGAA